jgi:hypothetical protein
MPHVQYTVVHLHIARGLIIHVCEASVMMLTDAAATFFLLGRGLLEIQKYNSILQKYYIVVLQVLTPYRLLGSYRYPASWYFYFEVGGSMFIQEPTRPQCVGRLQCNFSLL